MKKLFALILLIITLNSSAADGRMDYGLHFNSHSVVATERTRLKISPEKPINFDDSLLLTFDLAVREEPQFGAVMMLTTDAGARLHFVFSSPDNATYYPALLVNNKISVLSTPIPHTYTPASVSVSLDQDKELVRLVYAGDTVSTPLKLKDAKGIDILFGQFEDFDVAPIDIRNISISQRGRETHRWELKNHNDSVCYDMISYVPAVADNPHWILDDHVDWQEVYSLKTDEQIQTAYNPTDNLFYIVSDSKVEIVNPVDGRTTTVDVNGGYRAMKYSNHLYYDPISKRLISYNIKRRAVSVFDFESGRWSQPQPDNTESTFANHAFAVNDSVAYMFGGYGYYHYSNNLFRLNLNNGKFDELTLKPLPDPRSSAAAAYVDGKFYIFGGKGNDSGRQEMPARYYFDLYEYDAKTMQGTKLWEISQDTLAYKFILSPTMYYNDAERCFYVASTMHDGSVLRVSLDEPLVERVSLPVQTDMSYKDFVFDFYHNTKFDRFYLLIDKRLTNLSHDLTIYSIDGPFMPDYITGQTLPERSSRAWIWVVAALAVIALAGASVYVIIRRRRRVVSAVGAAEHAEPAAGDGSPSPTSPDGGADEAQEGADDLFASAEAASKTKYYDRGHGAISFLGGFNVRDKEGNDITTSFTARSKNLLILLLLYSEKYRNGVLISRLDEIIWADKDEESARNNRNVYMRKLRVLLEKIGNITITFDSGYFRINLNDVFFDYHDAVQMIEHINSGTKVDDEVLDRTLELQLFGPLLPHTQYEWLDQFKSDYSRLSISLLNNLLNRKMEDNEETTAFRIAETIMLHDPMSEEALRAKCVILCRRKMMGIAKDVYDNFCREYQKNLGEEYPVSFADICKPV